MGIVFSAKTLGQPQGFLPNHSNCPTPHTRGDEHAQLTRYYLLRNNGLGLGDSRSVYYGTAT